MADLVITTTQVARTARDDFIEFGVAGEAITVGQTIYKETDGKFYLASAAAAAYASCVGIALCTAHAANQWVTYQTSGTIVLGAAASVLQGKVYCLAWTFGGIAPESDIAVDELLTYIGVGDDSDGIVMPKSRPHASGVEHA